MSEKKVRRSVAAVVEPEPGRSIPDGGPAASVEVGSIVDTIPTLIVVVDAWGGNPAPARSVAGVSALEVGDEVIVALSGTGELIVLGRVSGRNEQARDIRLNGRRITIDAGVELVLECGSATITVRRDGSVSVRGERISTQARGTHRIRGGSVELN